MPIATTAIRGSPPEAAQGSISVPCSWQSMQSAPAGRPDAVGQGQEGQALRAHEGSDSAKDFGGAHGIYQNRMAGPGSKTTQEIRRNESNEESGTKRDVALDRLLTRNARNFGLAIGVNHIIQWPGQNENIEPTLTVKRVVKKSCRANLYCASVIMKNMPRVH
jgi:hypothetical protein